MRVVVALGGNALLPRGQRSDAATQRANIAIAVAAIAQLARDNELVVTHGNGPQVGLLALQSEALHDSAPYPLDVLGAESEGMIGYLLEQELLNQLADRPVATLLTQVIVDAADPAFNTPTKPIGPVYDRPTAVRLAAERGWSIALTESTTAALSPPPSPARSSNWQCSKHSSAPVCLSSASVAAESPSSWMSTTGYKESKPSSTKTYPPPF